VYRQRRRDRHDELDGGLVKLLLRDAQKPLLRAICRIMAREIVESQVPAGKTPSLVVEAIWCEDWASATYSGQRHRFELRLDGGHREVDDAVAAIAAKLGEVDVDVPGHIVAEFQLVEVATVDVGSTMSVVIVCEALTIED